jgi:AAA lid domain/ATPase family associated with various cellular activities (AAA)
VPWAWVFLRCAGSWSGFSHGRIVLDACARRDLGALIAILGTHGVTQGQISEMTGIGQGRLSEWVRHKRTPTASSTFEAFADGLIVPPRARQALGLAPVPLGGAGASPERSPGGRAVLPAQVPSGTARPSAPGLSGLQGLEGVRGQLDVVIAVLKAEQVRRKAGSAVRRPAWKNLVFTGPAGSGKSRTAIAVGQTYRKLGVLTNGHVLQMAAVDLVGAGPEETGKLVGEAARVAAGGILMINDAHNWYRLPDRGHQVLRRLHEKLSEYRDTLNDDLAVILAGQAEPLDRLLLDIPPLAARFRGVINFPGYTPGQLSAIFVTLADEAGLRLTTAARSKAAAVLARAESGHAPGNARLAVGLLNQATAAQARRLAAWSSRNQTAVALATINEGDIPDFLSPGTVLLDDDWPGQYL